MPVGADGVPTEALADDACCQTLLAAFDAGRSVATALGAELRFERGSSFAVLRPSGPLPGRPLGVEQSNSSVVFGNALIMKCFRRFAPGLNPDLEVPRFLVEHTPFQQVPRPLAGSNTAVAWRPRPPWPAFKSSYRPREMAGACCWPG